MMESFGQKERLSYKKRRIVTILSIAIIIVFIVLGLTIKTAYAEGGNNGGGRHFGGTIEMTTEDYTAIITEMAEEYAIMNKLDELFSVDPPSGDDAEVSLFYTLLEAPNSPVRTSREIIMTIAVALVIINMGIQLYQLVQREKESVETLMRIFIAGFISILAVIYIYDAMKTVESMGMAIWTQIKAEAYTAVDTRITYEFDEEEEAEEEENEGFSLSKVFSSVGNFFTELATTLRNQFFTAISYSIGEFCLTFTFYMIITSAYGLIIELCLRKVFVPLAMADIATEGFRSSSVMFVRGYFAMYLRIAAFFIIVALGLFCQYWAEEISNAEAAFNMNTALGPFGVCICSRMAMKATLTSTGEIIRESIGGQGS